jgi:hypothetical protein
MTAPTATVCRESTRCATLPTMPTYIRFVVADIHRNSGKKLGIFHAVLRLREEGRLYAHEEELHDSTRHWFNENLEKPTEAPAADFLLRRGVCASYNSLLGRGPVRKLTLCTDDT